MALLDPDDADRITNALFDEFRTLATILVQSREALLRITGPSRSLVADLILRSRAMMTEASRSELEGIKINSFDPKLREYLIMSMGSLPHEALRVLFLDGSRRLIADEQLQQGTLAQLAVYPRTVFRRALEHNAASIVLVHNHPSGDPTPSREDVRVTQILEQIGRALNVELLDHIIVTGSAAHHILNNAVLSGYPEASSGLTLKSPKASGNSASEDALANARSTLRRRMLRQQLIGSPELFGEPAWDMLLDLFIHECERKRLSLSSLCVQSSIPWSSALRLIKKMCDAGIMRRLPDPADRRRNFMRLEPDIHQRMRSYFSECGE